MRKTYEISLEDPTSESARKLIDELSQTLAMITGDSGRSSFDPESVLGPQAAFVVARDVDGNALGCGAFRPLQAGIAELKRMYAKPGTKGVGSAILHELEERARQLGYQELWLETRLINSHAVAFYESHSYQQIPNFGPYVGRLEAICLRKRL